MLELYDIYKINNSGSYSNIYKGIHKFKKKKVIIKFSYDELTIKLIKNEINMYFHLKRLKFKNNADIINIGVINGYNFIITKYINNKFNKININIVNQLLNILLFLYNNKIIHRDIKDDNFLIDKNKVILIDFGFSTFYNKQHMNNLIGNWKYSSYNCYKKKYIYDYKDDYISLIYMILNINNNSLPWNKNTSTNKLNYKLENHYNMNDIINKHFINIYNNITNIKYSELFVPLK